MFGELPGIGHVGQAVPLCRRAGKAERTSGLAAERGIDSQRRSHVHGVAHRLTDDRVRTMDAPRKAIALCRSEHFVLLGIVEVLDVQPPLVLPEWGLRERGLASKSGERLMKQEDLHAQVTEALYARIPG
jgi:hypothetical protein